jgi:predicted DNA-binding transcriptional regulator YafY
MNDRRRGAKRVDRVMDLQELLRARGSATVAELAAELGVSERTVFRDLATLRDRGVPVEAESGPGGGVRLDRDRGVVAVHLRLDESIALWLASTLTTAAMPLPWGGAAARALRKLLASLPGPRARALRALTHRVVVGRPASPRTYADLGRMPPELLPALERAFTEDRCLAFDYVDRHGRASRRVVEPHGLVVEPPALYILCRTGAPPVVRLFRLDRIQRAQVRDDLPFAPAFGEMWREFAAQHTAG